MSRGVTQTPQVSAQSLEAHLSSWAGSDPARAGIAATITALAAAASAISNLVARGTLSGALGSTLKIKGAGDDQKALDVTAHEMILAALAGTPVAWVGSEESDEPISIDVAGSLCLAVDPLDGSSNIDTNVSVGTIFSLLPFDQSANTTPLKSFLRPGRDQLAAGFFIYGPQTALVLTVGEGAHLYVLDRQEGTFKLVAHNMRIKPSTREYAINASNARHWMRGVRTYIEDCLAGTTGPRGVDFNMRWIASLVAEAYRILIRGGVFIYPADARKGYNQGRLRLVYEANPIALLVNEAAGAASNGRAPILDLLPTSLHQRTPLVFGDAAEVALIERYEADPDQFASRSPLFNRRGLLRA